MSASSIATPARKLSSTGPKFWTQSAQIARPSRIEMCVPIQRFPVDASYPLPQIERVLVSPRRHQSRVCTTLLNNNTTCRLSTRMSPVRCPPTGRQRRVHGSPRPPQFLEERSAEIALRRVPDFGRRRCPLTPTTTQLVNVTPMSTDTTYCAI
jgi:hypothetical protein